jgi:hypothetical protein
MHARGKLALATVTGGIALGAVLGLAANPVPTHAPEAPRQAALQDPGAADTSYQLADTGFVEPAPGWGADSYAPSWASEELRDWEPGYPAWTYTDFSDEPVRPPAEAEPATTAPAPAADPDASDILSPEPRGEGNLAALY